MGEVGDTGDMAGGGTLTALLSQRMWLTLPTHISDCLINTITESLPQFI